MMIIPRHLRTLALVACASLNLSAPGQSNDWNVAVLDQILAATPSGSTVAQVGDMEMLVSGLVAWRNELAGLPAPRSAFSGTAPLWTGGNVYYQFHASVSAQEKQAFLDATREWETFANVHFVLRTSQSNYILVEEVAGLSGGQATVGMIGGQQGFKIGPNAWSRAVLCHELGHTLGMVHEHQRSDRDSYVTILTSNIVSGQEGNFVKLPTSQNLGTYDFLSILHYSRNTFSVSPSTLNTIEPLPAYTQYLNVLGEGDPILTPSDRAGMAAKYGAGPTISGVVTHTLDGPPGSLRAALYFAFDHPGTTVTFNIPVSDPGYAGGVFTIQPTDDLPGLSRATTIDGSTQPGNTNPNGPEIVLNGAAAQTSSVFAHGLHFRGTNCTAHSLVINGFEGDGVMMDGTNTTGNTVSGCYLGINASGTAAAPNGLRPVNIAGGARGNFVGGTTAGARNVISGGGSQGCLIQGPGTTNNQVLGNYIGLNASGTSALPNTRAGVDIRDGASANLIGGLVAGSGNMISGNTLQGIAVSGAGTDGNLIAGNFIGLNPAGTAAIPNQWGGVDVYGGPRWTQIGGTSSLAGNVISGNTLQGVFLDGADVVGCVIQGNLIGLNAAGTAAVGNGWSGIQIANGSKSNLIGGASSGMRNVISGNGNYGVVITDPGSDGNVISGNYLGVNAAGTGAAPNTWAGVGIQSGAQSNTIGGSSPATGNVISGNISQGVSILDAGSDGNRIQGNRIGLNAAGTAALANGSVGILVYGGVQNTLIGGTSPAERNFISGNGQQGILIGDTATTGNVVQGNTLGLDVTHTLTIANGSSSVAIYAGASGNQIGGLNPGSANIMTGSPFDVVSIQDPGSNNNTVRGNSLVGTAGYRAIALYASGNNNAAAPSLSSATMTTNLTVTGSASGAPNTMLALDLYASTFPTLRQAQTFLGTTNVTTSGTGTANFTLALPIVVPAGQIITAAATDPSGNTSSIATGVAVSLVSSVNDGIPDAWRAAKFGGNGTTTNALSCATCDPDLDQANNWHEFRANTNPNNPASVLAAGSPIRSGQNMILPFASAKGVTYRVWVRDAIGSGFWTMLADQLIGTGGTLQITDPGAAAYNSSFYRLQVLP